MLIKIQGGTEKQRTIFYTALYRAFQMPTVFNDANGDYVGFDRKVHKASGFQYFTDLSLWDTFRTVHPLYTLIAPKDQRDMVVSLVKMFEQGGWLPRWPSGHGYSNSMLGTPADIVIADSYLKGIRDFDVEKAYQGMRRTALTPTPPGAAFSGREGVEHYLKYGYCPAGLVRNQLHADPGISIGPTMRFLSWRKPLAVPTMRLCSATLALLPKYLEPGDAVFSTSRRPREICRAVQAAAPDVSGSQRRIDQGLCRGQRIAMAVGGALRCGGFDLIVQEPRLLRRGTRHAFSPSQMPPWGHGIPGPYYWHGNEPDIHAAYLFNEAGRPDLTQKWVRWIMDHKYGDGYNGLDGNDDAGTISAWYVFSALGFFPVAGSDIYQLGSPLFEKAEVRLKNMPLLIVAENTRRTICMRRKSG